MHTSIFNRYALKLNMYLYKQWHPITINIKKYLTTFVLILIYTIFYLHTENEDFFLTI